MASRGRTGTRDNSYLTDHKTLDPTTSGPARIRQLGMSNSLTQPRSIWVITAFKTKNHNKRPFLTSKAMHVDASAKRGPASNYNQRRTDRSMGTTRRCRSQGSLYKDQPGIFNLQVHEMSNIGCSSQEVPYIPSHLAILPEETCSGREVVQQSR